MTSCATTFNILRKVRQKNVDYYVKSMTDGKPIRFVSFVEGLVKIAEGVDWETQGKGTLTKDTFKTIDDLVKNVTGAKDLATFLANATDESINSAMQKMHSYVQIMSAAIIEPYKIIDNKEISAVARGSLEYFVDYNDKAMRNKLELTWKPWRIAYNILFAPNAIFKNPITGETLFQYMGNFAAAYRMHDSSNRTLITKEGITNSATMISEHGIEYFIKAINDNATDKIHNKMIKDLLYILDPSQSAGEELVNHASPTEIEAVIKAKLRHTLDTKYNAEMQLQSNKDAYAEEVYNVLKKTQRQTNMFMYGVEDPLHAGKDGGPITPKEIYESKRKVDLGNGVSVDPFIKNWITNGLRIYDILSDMKLREDVISDLSAEDKVRQDESLIEMRNTWAQIKADVNNFAMRINYFPKPKDTEIETKNIAEVLDDFNVQFSHQKPRNVSENIRDRDETHDIITDIGNYMKEYRFTMHSVSAYLLARKVNQNMIDDNTLRITNPEAYAMLLARSEKQIKRLENPEAKSLSPFMEAYKNAMYSLTGLAIACRITGSTTTNVVAAAMNSMIKQPLSVQWERRRDYLKTMQGDDLLSEIAREIDHDSDNYRIMSKMTTVITKENVEQQKLIRQKVLDATPSILNHMPARLLERIAKFNNMASDRLMNSFYGITPRSWELCSMAGTENALMRQCSAEAFYDSKQIGIMWAKSRGLDINNLSDSDKIKLKEAMHENYENNQNYYYNTVKQMYGSYTEDVKADYASNFMKDAGNIISIGFGTQLIMHSAFKQISVNNADMIARIQGSHIARGIKYTDAETNTNMSGLGLVVLNGLYNFLCDKIMETKYGKSIPSVGFLRNSDIFEDANRKYKVLAYAVKDMMGIPQSQDDMLNAARYWKFLLGVGVGGDTSRFDITYNNGEYEAALKEYDGMMDIIKEYTTKNFYPLKNLVNFVPLYIQIKGFTNAMIAEDITPAQRKSLVYDALNDGQFYADGGNKMLKLAADVGILFREGVETYGSEDGNYQDAEKYRGYVLGMLNRVSQANIYMRQMPFTSKGYWWNTYDEISKLTQLDYLVKGNSYNKNYDRAEYYGVSKYELDKAVRDALSGLKVPSWELKKLISEINYNKI